MVVQAKFENARVGAEIDLHRARKRVGNKCTCRRQPTCEMAYTVSFLVSKHDAF
jgi:hypothetical protein